MKNRLEEIIHQEVVLEKFKQLNPLDRARIELSLGLNPYNRTEKITEYMNKRTLEGGK